MAAYDDYVYKLVSDVPQPVFVIELPKDLQWSDELSWNSVEQNVVYSTTGELLIQEGVKKQGRPITLIGLDNMAWLTREQGLILYNMVQSPGLVLTLTFFNKLNPSEVLFSKSVRFRNYEKPALDMRRILHWDQYEAGAWYIVNLIKLMETSAYGE